MFSLHRSRSFFLTGFSVVFVWAAVFAIHEAPITLRVPKQLKEAMASFQPVEMVQFASSLSAASPQRDQAAPVPASVLQVLPLLERRIDDWRGYQPQKLTIAPYADLALEFEMTSVREENGRTVWRGRNALSGAFLVTVATENEWHAVLEIPAASSFEFHISGQAASVTEKNDPVLCGNPQGAAEAAVAGNVNDQVTAPDKIESDSDSDSEGDANTVDVLFFYDAGTLAANGGNARLIETAIAASVEAANVVLQNSAVNNLRWRYVAAYPVPDYTATDKLEDDLNLVTHADNPQGRIVAEKSALHGIDQVVLYVSGRRKDNYDGISWVPSIEGSVLHHSVIIWNSGYVVLAHELAHNFGCHHDRQTENARDGDEKFSYGFNFKLNGRDTGTVMSYAPSRVPFFSNPDVYYQGKISLGVPEDQPKAANNARVLRGKARLMANFREASEAPIITAQPQPAAVAPGAGFSLSISAVGSGLVFQWRKNGIDLPGANNAVYSKSSANETDRGDYNVVVSNPAGQALSASASVAVTEPVAAASAAPSTGSGGGGGAVEPWVLAALALLGSLRLIGRVLRAHRA
jgi:hypothetical protein